MIINNASSASLSAHDQTLILMKEIAEQSASPFIIKLVEKFTHSTRTFSLPSYSAQDITNSEDRRSDLVGGALFTSDEYPWPQMADSGLYMQPILQLNLTTTGKLLGKDLGTDTLQEWGPVAVDVDDLSTDIEDFCIRVIPVQSIAKAPSDFLPDWKVSLDGSNTVFFHMVFNVSDERSTLSKVTWGQPLQMFGCIQQLFDIAWAELRKDLDSYGSDELMEFAEQLMEQLESSRLMATNNTDYLGGWGGQTGGESDPSYGDNLIVRLTDQNGFYFAMKWDKHPIKGLIFEPSFTIRS